MPISNRMKTWLEVIKLGRVIKQSKEMNDFYRNIVLEVFQQEGWFEYLDAPRTVEDLLGHFGYTDRDFCQTVVNTLVTDKILKNGGTEYSMAHPVVVRDITPQLLSEGNIEISKDYVKSLPKRLMGEFYSSTSGFNLFSFDEALNSGLYSTIRKAIFAFSGALDREGRFLDVGTGSGVGLSEIFTWYLEKGAFDKDPVTVELHGLDIDEKLLNIAGEEFFQRVNRVADLSSDELRELEAYKPTFKVGTATEIPYPDEYFDTVYISQVLHWTNPIKAIQEMYRVTKKGGQVIGGQIFIPHADIYLNLTMLLFDGAYGFFTKKEMKQWAEDAGFRKSSFCTPVAAFTLYK